MCLKAKTEVVRLVYSDSKTALRRLLRQMLALCTSSYSLANLWSIDLGIRISLPLQIFLGHSISRNLQIFDLVLVRMLRLDWVNLSVSYTRHSATEKGKNRISKERLTDGYGCIEVLGDSNNLTNTSKKTMSAGLWLKTVVVDGTSSVID